MRNGYWVVVSMLLSGCGPAVTTPDGGTGGVGSCGEGTVQVGNVCELAGGSTGSTGSSSGAITTILNGATAVSATSHWTFNGQVIAFYADGTGTYSELWAQGLACPGTCTAPLVPCGSTATCTDVDTDSDNCGSCGQVCPFGTKCTDGACGTVSTSGTGSGGDMGPTLGGNGEPQPGVFAFSWSGINADGILVTPSTQNASPFDNLTDISGGVSDANFTGVDDGGSTLEFTLVSGPACISG
jgi:hypothetical protein